MEPSSDNTNRPVKTTSDNTSRTVMASADSTSGSVKASSDAEDIVTGGKNNEGTLTSLLYDALLFVVC